MESWLSWPDGCRPLIWPVGDVAWTVEAGVPQILDIVVPVSRWSVPPELNRRAALQMLGVLIDRLVTGWPGEVAAPAAGQG
jgi:hypothetical protein